MAKGKTNSVATLHNEGHIYLFFKMKWLFKTSMNAYVSELHWKWDALKSDSFEQVID